MLTGEGMRKVERFQTYLAVRINRTQEITSHKGIREKEESGLMKGMYGYAMY